MVESSVTEIQTIKRYIDESLFEPTINWPEHEFMTRSYSRWAAYQIIKMIEENPDIDAYILIDDFLVKMDRLSFEIDNKAAHFIFSIARETAEDIGCLFI